MYERGGDDYQFQRAGDDQCRQSGSDSSVGSTSRNQSIHQNVIHRLMTSFWPASNKTWSCRFLHSFGRVNSLLLLLQQQVSRELELVQFSIPSSLYLMPNYHFKLVITCHSTAITCLPFLQHIDHVWKADDKRPEAHLRMKCRRINRIFQKKPPTS